jgi:hypothetical protein
MAGTTVTLTGDEASLLRAFQKIQAAQQKTDEGFKKTKDTAQDSSRKIAEDMEAAGNATTMAFNGSLKELRKMGPEGRAAAAEVEKHLRATGQAGRKSFETVLAELGKLDDEAAKVAVNAKKSFEDTAQATDKVFGKSAIDEVKQFATQWLSVGAAVGLLSSALQTMRQEQSASLDSLMGQADPERRLAQVAKSGQDLDAMIAKSDELATKYGIGRDQARGLMFSARSEGFEPDIEMIARASQVVDVTSQASLAGVLGRQFGGEGGSTEQRLSAVLAAAEQSAFNFETVGKNVIKSASATRAAGSDMAETLATNATMANLIGDTAGDRVKAFAALVSLKPDLAGKGVMGAVGALSQMDEATRRDALGGGMEVNEAYRLLLENKDSIQEMTATVRGDVAATGAGGGVLAGKIAIVEGSERFQARRDVASAQVSRTIAAENVFSAEESRFRAGQDLLRAEQIKSGSSQMFGFFGQKAGEAVRMANGSSESALTASEFIGRQDMSKVFLGPILDPLIKRSVRGFRDSFGPDSQGMDAVVEKLEGIRQNTSQAPVITGAALQSPVAAAAAP